MKRPFSDYAYGEGPRAGCWWDETIAAPEWPILEEPQSADVAIIGAGFTGISAALHLAEAGVSVIVLEAGHPGWGASGRNGGFCCLGGSRLDEPALTRKFGAQAAADYQQAEQDAVALVADLLVRHDIDADTHSDGETLLAHRPRDMENLRKKAEAMQRAGGPEPVLIEPEALPAHGMNGPFHGALTTPVGFGLNPRKYLLGIAAAAQRAGARLFQQSAATGLTRRGSGYEISTKAGQVRAGQIILATNGYSSEDLPPWLAGRFIPSQSSVLVTRPMSQSELDAQGWTTAQMSYDTRHLLHYFRLMPDRRFLFGMRGGLMASAASEAATRKRTRRDFEKMFPAWKEVESPNSWSGMVCLSRNQTPYAGPVPGLPGVFAGLAYHGNGVAMGSYVGRVLAGLAGAAQVQQDVPQVLSTPMRRFPLGRARRLLMPPAYLAFALADL